ncbi:hypothetical protein PR048_024495 [Dryococelus australis]|uniref:Uncharacterized protein n=1 Tax=Dryococelus australis TaxID=614101 RepID=A0ABQ9GNQ0_9NEOP|nr:hypothetical protein PR048_024495 [Dryococelus australis]
MQLVLSRPLGCPSIRRGDWGRECELRSYGDNDLSVVGHNVSSTARSLDTVHVARGGGIGEGIGRAHPSIRLELWFRKTMESRRFRMDLNPLPLECESCELPLRHLARLDSSVLCILKSQSCVFIGCSPAPGSYGVRKVFPCKSAIGSEACRTDIINCDPIAKYMPPFDARQYGTACRSRAGFGTAISWSTGRPPPPVRPLLNTWSVLPRDGATLLLRHRVAIAPPRRSALALRTVSRLTFHLWRSGFNPRLVHSGFSCGNRAGRCRSSAGFVGDLPFPPPFHSGAAPYSPQLTPIGSEDLGVKSCSNLFTHSHLICDGATQLVARHLQIQQVGRRGVESVPNMAAAGVYTQCITTDSVVLTFETNTRERRFTQGVYVTSYIETACLHVCVRAVPPGDRKTSQKKTTLRFGHSKPPGALGYKNAATELRGVRAGCLSPQQLAARAEKRTVSKEQRRNDRAWGKREIPEKTRWPNGIVRARFPRAKTRAATSPEVETRCVRVGGEWSDH